METQNLDLVIIGGGPSGSLSGYHAARIGLRVLILEKSPFPRVKPCGGGLTLRALRYLPFPIDHLVKHRDRRVFFSVNRSPLMECQAPDFFSVQVIRPEFDSYLLEQAQKAGVEVRTEKVVEIKSGKGFTVTTPTGVYQSRYLVAADGSQGNSRKLLESGRSMGYRENRREQKGAALEGDIDLSKVQGGREIGGTDVEFYFQAYHSSYAWVFPKNEEGDLVNVGVYTYNGEKLKLSRRALCDFVKDRFGLGAEAITNLRGYPLNFDCRARSLHPDMIQVGDAAGFPEPLWGEGLHHALKSAHLAGLALGEVYQQGGSLQRVYRGYCREIFTDLTFYHFLANGFNRWPMLGRLFINLPFVSSFLKGLLIRVMVSGRPTYHILSRFLTFPFWKSYQPNSITEEKTNT